MNRPATVRDVIVQKRPAILKSLAENGRLNVNEGVVTSANFNYVPHEYPEGNFYMEHDIADLARRSLCSPAPFSFLYPNIPGLLPVHVATTEDATDCLSVLLENGADPNITYQKGGAEGGDWAPLSEAVSRNFTKCAELLLTYGARIERWHLSIAMKSGHPDMACLLLSNIPDGQIETTIEDVYNKAPGSNGDTLIHLARSARQVEVMLRIGMDPNSKDNAGNTPMHIMANMARREELKVLFDHPLTNVRLRNNAGDSPMDIVCRRMDRENMSVVRMIRDRMERDRNSLRVILMIAKRMAKVSETSDVESHLGVFSALNLDVLEMIAKYTYFPDPPMPGIRVKVYVSPHKRPWWARD